MLKDKKIKYDYSNPESQKLFEEFTILLADITKYIEEKEKRVLYLESELARLTRIRYMAREIVRKLLNTVKTRLLSVKEKLLAIARKLRDKLNTFF